MEAECKTPTAVPFTTEKERTRKEETKKKNPT